MVQTRISQRSQNAKYHEVPTTSDATELAGIPVRQVSFDEEDLANASLLNQSIEIQPRLLEALTLQPSHSCYWQSNEAGKIFCPIQGETPEKAADNMIHLLESALRDSHYGNDFLVIIEGSDKYHLLNSEDKKRIFYKVGYLFAALECAKAIINGGQPFSFHRCCDFVVTHLAPTTPPRYRVKANTVTQWFRDFRKHRLFAHPLQRLQRERESS